MPWRRDPVVHEIFTWVWLRDLSDRLGRSVTLADVPDDVWDDVGRPGFDAVWLMGVWERSPVGAAIARRNEGMRAAQQAALVDLTDDDVVGSAYCIKAYRVDARLGGDEGLATARAALAERGVRLVLDYVPNHVAPDHDWLLEHPEYLIGATAEDLQRDPASFLTAGGRVFACGRDPYFPAWPEVVQIDASRPETRLAAAEVVGSIAARADGVRCDMAMLVLDDIFVRTWGARATGGPSPDGGRGYWPTVIGAVKRDHPEFAFWAEAYWDLEPVLVSQGFDACYDKRLYDRLVHREPASSIHAHLGADVGYQRHTVRFVENHDEPRAASLLHPAANRAAAAAVFSLPGVALLHEGQAEGRQVHVPVTLGRRPVEAPDVALRAWYDRLLHALATGLRSGEWTLRTVDGWPDNRSCERMVAWTWTADDAAHLVVINLSDERADGRIVVPAPAGTVELDDLLSGDRYERDGDDMGTNGLYVALDGHGIHLLRYPTAAPAVSAS